MAATVWKGHLTFGMVSIPIKLFSAARAEKVHLHYLQRNTGARVRQVFVANEPSRPNPTPTEARAEAHEEEPPAFTRHSQSLVRSREPGIAGQSPATPLADAPSQHEISRSELVRGFEYEKDKYVEFEPEELKKIAPKASEEMQIIEFVRFEEVDPIYLESSYYVAADTGGDKAYALLFETLKKTGYAAISEFVMHRRDQTMILRSGRNGIIAHTLFYEDEIRRANEFQANSELVAAKEMDLAVKLVDALATKYEPEKYKDKFRERFQTAISAKIEPPDTGQPEVVVRKAPVVDIVTALKDSLAKLKKPAAREGNAGSTAARARKKASNR